VLQGKVGYAVTSSARAANGLELAKRARVAQGYISALEAGEKSNPSVAVIRKLAKALGVPVTALLS